MKIAGFLQIFTVILTKAWKLFKTNNTLSCVIPASEPGSRINCMDPGSRMHSSGMTEIVILKRIILSLCHSRPDRESRTHVLHGSRIAPKGLSGMTEKHFITFINKNMDVIKEKKMDLMEYYNSNKLIIRSDIQYLAEKDWTTKRSMFIPFTLLFETLTSIKLSSNKITVPLRNS